MAELCVAEVNDSEWKERLERVVQGTNFIIGQETNDKI